MNSMKTNLLPPPSLKELIACALVLINKHPTSLHLDGLRRITGMSLDTDLFNSQRVPRAIAKTIFSTPLTTSIPPEDLYPIQKQAAMMLGIHHDMPFMQDYKTGYGLTISDLDEIGWSKHMIKKYLGQPDTISPYGIYYSTYDKARVEKASHIRTLKDALHLVQWQRKETWSSRYNGPSKRYLRLVERRIENEVSCDYQLNEPTTDLVVTMLEIINPHIPSINSTIINAIPGLFLAGHFVAMVCMAQSEELAILIDSERSLHDAQPNIFTMLTLISPKPHRNTAIQKLNDIVCFQFLDDAATQIMYAYPEYEKYEDAAYWYFEDRTVINDLFEKIIIDHYCNPSFFTQKQKTF